MRIDSSTTTILTQRNIKTHHLRIANAEKLGHILTSGLYSDPLTGVIREVLSNAWDAHNRARELGRNPPRPIEVYIDKNTSSLVVSDCGTGVDPMLVPDLVLSLGGSDKDQSNREIGGWGLGFKSPYALASQWNFENRWNGRLTVYLCHMQDLKLSYSVIAEDDTDLPDGMTIRVPIKPDEHNRALMLARYFARWFNASSPGYSEQILVDNELIVGIPWQDDGWTRLPSGYSYRFFDRQSGDEHAPLSPFWPRNSWMENQRGRAQGAMLLVGGVPYVAKDNGATDSIWVHGLAVRCPIGSVDVTPSRDTLRQTERTKRAIAEAANLVEADIVRNLLARVRCASTPIELSTVLSIASSYRDMAQTLVQAVLDQPTPFFKAIKLEGRTGHIYIKKSDHPFDFLARSASAHHHVYVNMIGGIFIRHHELKRSHIRSTYRWGSKSNFTIGEYSAPGHWVEINSATTYLLDDLGKGAAKRIRFCTDDRVSKNATYLACESKTKPLSTVSPAWIGNIIGSSTYATIIPISTLKHDPPAKQTKSKTSSASTTVSVSTVNVANNEIRGFFDPKHDSPVKRDLLTERHVYIESSGHTCSFRRHEGASNRDISISRYEADLIWRALQKINAKLDVFPDLHDARLITIGKSAAQEDVNAASDGWTHLQIAYEAIHAIWKKRATLADVLRRESSDSLPSNAVITALLASRHCTPTLRSHLKALRLGYNISDIYANRHTYLRLDNVRNMEHLWFTASPTVDSHELRELKRSITYLRPLTHWAIFNRVANDDQYRKTTPILPSLIEHYTWLPKLGTSSQPQNSGKENAA